MKIWFSFVLTILKSILYFKTKIILRFDSNIQCEIVITSVFSKCECCVKDENRKFLSILLLNLK